MCYLLEDVGFFGGGDEGGDVVCCWWEGGDLGVLKGVGEIEGVHGGLMDSRGRGSESGILEIVFGAGCSNSLA